MQHDTDLLLESQKFYLNLDLDEHRLTFFLRQLIWFYHASCGKTNIFTLMMQGPDGGISASKYCYIGGFDATRF